MPIAPRRPVVSPAATLAPSVLLERRDGGLGGVAHLVAALLELLPHVGLRRARARRTRRSGRASSRRSCRPRGRGRWRRSRRGAHIIGVTHATCGLTAWPTGTHFSAQRLLVVGHPVRGLLGIDEREVSAPMPFSAASRIVSRRQHATHSGGCGFCTGLGTTLRGGICTNWPSTPVNGVSVMHRIATSRPSSHASRLTAGSMPKPPSSASRRRLARAELDAAVRHEVEHRDPLGGAGRVVVVRRGLDDAVAEADVLGALAGAARNTSGARGVRVLLEEVVLDLPHVLDAELVGELDLVERVLDRAAARCRRARAAGAGARRRCRTSWTGPRLPAMSLRVASCVERDARMSASSRVVGVEHVLELAARSA